MSAQVLTPRPGTSQTSSQENAYQVLIRANIALSQGAPYKAIESYTHVLYNLSPGHPCAFLNRSLAYVCVDLPELAATDAYRAAFAADQLRAHDTQQNARYQDITKYFRLEKLHVDRNSMWTTIARRLIKIPWAQTPLASIVINDVPQPNPTRVRPFLTDDRKGLCSRLKMRAYYRLVVALTLCRGGAVSDAFGTIDDLLARYSAKKCWEMGYFTQLGNAIMNSFANEWDETFKIPQGAPSANSAEVVKEKKEIVKQKLRSKTTMIKQHDYLFESPKPNLELDEWRETMSSWVQKCTRTCSTHVLTPANTDNQSQKPYLELRANEDILPGARVLSEQSISSVTTSIPEDVIANSRLEGVDYYYCDACSTLLAIQGDCPDYYHGSTVPLPVAPGAPRLSMELSPTLEIRSYGGNDGDSPVPEDLGADPVLFSGGHDLDTSETSPGHSNAAQSPDSLAFNDGASTASPDFMFCCPTHILPTCSKHCRILSANFDRGLCHTSIERELRQSYLPAPGARLKTLAERKKLCLRDLIFVRTLATTLNLDDRHPLNHEDILFATFDPNSQHNGERQEETWSLHENVVRPITYIHQLCYYLDVDPFTCLEQTDGWMINTLVSKINHSMRVSKGPRYIKYFDTEGNVETTFDQSHELWEGLALTGASNEEEQVWIGTLNPVFNLIRVADDSKGEKPNVVVIQKEGIHVFAASEIKEGEPLLRAADGVEGPRPTEEMLNEA